MYVVVMMSRGLDSGSILIHDLSEGLHLMFGGHLNYIMYAS
jgi:hypothetical protein